MVIVGGGFAGLAAARALRSAGSDVSVTLLDRKVTSDFLPMLPDIVSGRMAPDIVAAPLDGMARRLGFRFVRDAVQSVDTDARLVRTTSGEFPYDRLVIAPGMEPNYYGHTEARDAAIPLAHAADAVRIRDAVGATRFLALVVAGGGYTGVELATHLWRTTRTWPPADRPRIAVVEAAPAILGALPEWMRVYCRRNLARLGIETFTNCRVSHVSDGRIELSDGHVFASSALFWTAGMQSPEHLRAMPVEFGGQGRVRVNACLLAKPDVFVAGDAAWVEHAGRPLRMGVPFAIAQGALAGRNALAAVRGQPLTAYRPWDPGYLVPMANGTACGQVLGRNVRGPAALALHYLMCVYRASDGRRRWKTLTSVIGGGGRSQEPRL
jgi:NADH dehydrogenase